MTNISQGFGISVGKPIHKAGGEPPEPIPVVAANLFDHETTVISNSNEPGTAVVVGVVFKSITQGKIKSIDFWKFALDSSTDRSVGLYDMDENLIASGRSNGNEPVGYTGWVTVDLDEEVTIDANINHIAAVQYPTGYYPTATTIFYDEVVNGKLIGLSNSAVENGRYKYNASLTFPSETGSGTSYGVDIDFYADPFPTAQSAGLLPGVPLTEHVGEIHLWDGGETILENMHIIDGFVLIQAQNCEVRNCWIECADRGAAGLIRVDTGSSDGAGLKVENCFLDGKNQVVNGIAGQGEFLNNKIIGVDNGINCYGPMTVKGNYIELTENPALDAHYDCIEMNAGIDINIRHNTLINHVGQTSAIQMNNFAGNLSDVEVIDNYMYGGGYTVYCDNTHSEVYTVDAASIHVYFNKVGIGLFGYAALYSSGVQPYGNYDATTGEPVM